MLYLHETIDIVGTGQEPYMQTVIERARHSEEQGISRLVGTFKVIGSTGRWPRVVNLWEMDSWEHWSQTLERQFLPEKMDAKLAPWWARATQWRSGGFDRILEPAGYCPTVAELRSSGLSAWVCVQTIVRTAPGKRTLYMEKLGTMLRPVLESENVRLIGAYMAPMLSDEMIALWAAPHFLTLCRLYERRKSHDALQEWQRVASKLRYRLEMTWLVPFEQVFFHPHAPRK